MMNFSVPGLLLTIQVIAHLHRDTTNAQARDWQLPDEQRQDLIEKFTDFRRVSRTHGLERTEARLRRLLADLPRADFYTARRLHIDTSILHQALVDDLEERHFYHYPKSKGVLVLGAADEWAKTYAAFGSARPDIEAGVDCFALGHPTASVFHMMRVAEFGLRGIARERKVPLPPKVGPIEWATWQDLIDAIRTAARNLANAFPRGEKRDAVRDFYMGALGEYEAFKDEYRNHVMHTRKSYREPIALNVLNHVRGFMERLSAKTNERGKAIGWR
jgi:hypothetical protein